MKYTNSLVVFLCFFLGVTLTSFIPIVSADDNDPCGTCSGCLKPSGDCNKDDYEQTSCEQIDLIWCGSFDCVDYVPEKPIDNFQLKTVGVSDLDANQDQDNKEPSPVRVYLNKFGMTVQLFFEGHPDHVSDTTLIDVALYAASDATSSDDCTLCTSSTVIKVSGEAFATKVTECIGGNCQDNVPISCWDTSEVTNMDSAFRKTGFEENPSFNDSINCWNVESVTSMQHMFRKASNFDQPINDWNVARVTTMESMFQDAINFNQCLSSWADKAPSNVIAPNFFLGSGCQNKTLPSSYTVPWCQDEDEQCSAPSELEVETNTPPPCGENGAALPSILYNVNLVSYNDDNYNGFFTQLDDSQCFPRTTNGVVAQAEIEMTENPLDLDSNLASLIYDASEGTNDGQLQFCARIAYYIDNVDAAEVTWKKYDSTDCVGALTEINGSKSFVKQQSEFTVEAMLAQCKSMCELDDACVAFNFRDNREQLDYEFGGSSCKFWSTITDTPDAADGLDSKDCWVSKELISYIDTKVVLDVSIAADIEFTQAVDISSDQTPVTTVNQDVSAVIEVDSFLCGDPGENGGAPYGDAYSLGQSFRVCVDVKATDEDKFRLTNFGEVKCSTNSGLESIIIRLVAGEAIASSVLTTLFNNDATAGAKSVASGTPSTQIEASERAISFSTVVTNAYLTGDDDTLTCVGSVDVDTVTQRRQLVSFTVPNPVSSSLSSGRRRMEEETGAVAGAVDFGATIKLSLSSSSSVTASGPFPLWATTTTLVIALVVGWSL